MKNKYRIGFITFTVIAALAISFAYYYSSVYMSESLSNTDSENKNIEAVPADGHAFNENCYYLMKLNDYVVVYNSDRKTIYEYTDIIYDELPALLKEEVKNGKYIESLEELYGFLENYSS